MLIRAASGFRAWDNVSHPLVWLDEELPEM